MSQLRLVANQVGFYRHLGWRSTGTVDRLGDEVLELFLSCLDPPDSVAALEKQNLTT